MGTFVVRVQAVGGHGCQREIKHGDVVPGCGEPSCPDCITRDYVRRMQSIASVEVATLTHWPWPQFPTITDDLLTKRRTGSF